MLLQNIMRIVMLAASLGLGLLTYQLWQDNEQLNSRGLLAIAQVTDGDSRQECSTDSEGYQQCRMVYSIAYRFTSSYEELVEGRKEVSEGLYEQALSSGEVQVRYLPDNPQIIEVEDGANARLLLFAGIGTVVLLLGSLLPWKSPTYFSRYERYLRELKASDPQAYEFEIAERERQRQSLKKK